MLNIRFSDRILNKMSAVPSYFDHIASRGEKSKTHPFKYVDEEHCFYVGDLRIQAIDFDPYKFNPYDLGIDYEGIPVKEMPEHPGLIPSFGSLIAGPKFHDWINESPPELWDTYKVMVDVFRLFVELDENLSMPSRSHMGFGSGLSEYGNLHLQVLGNCACLGPDPMSHIARRDDNGAGFAEYDLHNADVQAQRVSLYAGFGHIARLSSEQDRNISKQRPQL